MMRIVCSVGAISYRNRDELLAAIAAAKNSYGSLSAREYASAGF